MKVLQIWVDDTLYHQLRAKKGTRTWVQFLNDVSK